MPPYKIVSLTEKHDSYFKPIVRWRVRFYMLKLLKKTALLNHSVENHAMTTVDNLPHAILQTFFKNVLKWCQFEGLYNLGTTNKLQLMSLINLHMY